MKALDLTGDKYEHFTVIERIGSKKGRSYWKCECECGKIFETYGKNIVNKTVSSCGCIKNKKIAKSVMNDKNNIDLTGKMYGCLEVVCLSSNSKREGSERIWSCLCHNCGRKKDFVQYALNNVISCGCIKDKKASERIKKSMGIQDGTNLSKIKSDKMYASNTSGVKGISYAKNVSKWHAYIQFKGKLYNLGYYDLKEEAAQARRVAEEKLFGEFLDWYNNEFNGK